MSEETKTAKTLDEAWQSIPPLVRASVAFAASRYCISQARAAHAEAVDPDLAGMARRVKVARMSAEACVVLARLLEEMANEADAEAVVRGIDADTRGNEPEVT